MQESQESTVINAQGSWVIRPKKVIELPEKEKEKIRMQRRAIDINIPPGLSDITSLPDIEKTIIKGYSNKNKVSPIKSLIIYQKRNEDINKLIEQKIGVEFNYAEIENRFVKCFKHIKHSRKETEVLFSVGKAHELFDMLKAFNELASFSERMKDDIAAFFSSDANDIGNIRLIRQKIFGGRVLTLFYLSENTVLKNLETYNPDALVSVTKGIPPVSENIKIGLEKLIL